MRTTTGRRALLGALVGLGALGMALVVSGAVRPATEALGGPDRYLTMVSTDKPIYRPGETVYVRGVLLHALTNRPLPADARPNPAVTITGPKGETVSTATSTVVESVMGYAWTVPAGQAGGEYKVKVSYPFEGYTPAERSFDVRVYRAPRLKNQIVFVRDGYGPGDTVAATLHTERAEGGAPVGAAVTITARVDGAEVYRGSATVDAEGDCRASFPLPATIARGEGTLAFAIEDGGVVETATKTIPILLQTVDLTLYPEGGELVAGLPNRVYVEAFTPAQKPADLAGRVTDSDGRVVARFRTEHEGRGRFVFTPAAEVDYTLRIDEPAGIATTYPLPAVKTVGGTLRALDDRTRWDRPVLLDVGAAATGSYTVTLAKRDQPLDRVTVKLAGGSSRHIALQPRKAAGVLVTTLWGPDGVPIAERLVYRDAPRRLRVKVTPSKARPVPGETVELTVETRDAKGQPVAAMVGLTVTDDSVLELVEKREQAPRLPAMVLLENDVRDLKDAEVYLDRRDPKAAVAVDLLLGTQGWRRFVFVRPTEALTTHGDRARRALALRVPPPTVTRTATGMGGGGIGRGVGRLGAAKGAPGGFDFDSDVIEGALVRPDGALLDAVKMPVPADVPVPVAAAPPAQPVAAAHPAPAAEDREAEAAERERGPAAAAARGQRVADEGGLLQVMAGERIAQEPWPVAPATVVREYAHRARPDRKAGDRSDFTETLYWTAGVRTDAATGRAKVTFALNDSVTAFRVMADAFDATGGLARATRTIESVEPFYVEPKLPLEVTAGDRIALPVAFVNGGTAPLSGVTLTATAAAGVRVDLGPAAPFTLAAGARERRVLPVTIAPGAASGDLVLAASAGDLGDRVTRPLRVVPRGFPVEVAGGGMVDGSNPGRLVVHVGATQVANSAHTTIAIFPTPLANLTAALERLIQEPYGCFEQTSSTTYPLVMAQQYFTTHTGVPADLIERSRDLLKRGYDRLVGFECRAKGYEWFGEDPGHEALSAYGLMEFSDMAKVASVDRAMLDRTRAWLLGTRDGEGGFTRKRRALHTWVEDCDASNGYILWALLESGQAKDEIAKEIEAFARAARASENSYVKALGANVLALAGDTEGATALRKELAAKQEQDGQVGGATTSIVGSRGDALAIETTSLALLGWLRDPAPSSAGAPAPAQFTGNVESSIRWLAEVCKAGRFGSTQSTVLALRAIVAYDAARARAKAAGEARVYVDGQPVGDPVHFDETTQSAIQLPDVGELVGPGDHTIELRMTNGAAMPYSIALTYFDDQPASAKDCRVDLKVALGAAPDLIVTEGDVTEARVTVTNRAAEAIPTPIAIIGLPGGLEPRHDQLKELRKAGTIDAYEVRGREVVLYWRTLAAGETRDLPLSLVAAIPGEYTGPASRAYEYYGDEWKTWAAPLQVTVAAK
jgi:hypothetical protein